MMHSLSLILCCGVLTQKLHQVILIEHRITVSNSSMGFAVAPPAVLDHGHLLLEGRSSGAEWTSF